MPLLEAIPLILSGIQAISAFTSNDNNRPKPQVPSATLQAVAGARQLANATVSPGYTTAEQSMRKAGADAIAQAQRTVTDPTQLQDIVSRINSTVQSNISNLGATNEQYHAQMLENLNTQLSNLSNQQFQVQQLKDQQYMQEKAAKANLLGGAIENVNQYVNQRQSNKMAAEFPAMVQNFAKMFAGNNTGSSNTDFSVPKIPSFLTDFQKPTIGNNKYFPVLGRGLY